MNTFGTFNSSEEALAREMWEFRTCQRSDGSYYGTGGQCRKGTETDKPDKDKTKEGFSKKELRKASDEKIKQLSGAMSKDDPLKKDLEAELARREKAKEITTSDMKKFVSHVGMRAQGDGEVYEEGGVPDPPPAKMSKKELERFVKDSFKVSFGRDSSWNEFILDELREENPKLAKKFEAAIEKNGGSVPVKSVTAEKYYHDGDKSKHPGIRGKINGVEYDMPNTAQLRKSQEPDLGFYFGRSYY